jgi:hypothetical protein
MPPLTELSLQDLRDAGAAIETLIEFRDYLPPGEQLLTLARRKRTDIRELLGMPPAPHSGRGHERKPLAELKDADLIRLGDAAAALYCRFADYMDDPDSVRHLRRVLGEATVESSARVADPKARAS